MSAGKSAMLVVLGWLWLTGASGADRDELLDPDAAFSLGAEVKDARTLVFSWTIAEDHYLYRHRFKLTSQTAGVEAGTPVLPPGEAKHDNFFGEVEIYRNKVVAELPIRRVDADVKRVTVEAVYQGCAESRVCYLPIRKLVTLELP